MQHLFPPYTVCVHEYDIKVVISKISISCSLASTLGKSGNYIQMVSRSSKTLDSREGEVSELGELSAEPALQLLGPAQSPRHRRHVLAHRAAGTYRVRRAMQRMHGYMFFIHMLPPCLTARRTPD